MVKKKEKQDNQTIEKIIPKEKLDSLIKGLNKDFKFIVPKETEDEIEFDYLDSDKEEYHFPEYQNLRVSPKKFLFPRKEVLYSFEKEGTNIKIKEKEEIIEEQVIFGIRSCDARSYKILDTFFSSGKYSDPYYFSKRNKTLLIGLACNEPMTACFCTSVGGAPFSSDGLDAILYDLGDKYIFKIISEKGSTFSKYVSEYPDVKKADLKKKEEWAKLARDKIKFDINLDSIEKDLDGLFESDIWSTVSRRCISCGACSYENPIKMAGNGLEFGITAKPQFLHSKHLDIIPEIQEEKERDSEYIINLTIILKIIKSLAVLVVDDASKYVLQTEI